MLETPEIVVSEAQPTAVIHLTVPRPQIREAMGPAIQEVLTTVAAQAIGPIGPVYSYHPRMDPEVFDFEVGVPVGGMVEPAGRVRAGELPAVKVARAVYVGAYEGLGPAWGELDAWMRANGHEPAPGLWERYLSGPESSPDPTHWRTELNHPVAG